MSYYDANILDNADAWKTASAQIGVAHHQHDKQRAVQKARIAGLATHDAAYTNAANDFPRFERQKIRGIYDEGIINGTKVPHPELLRRHPNREIPQAPLVTPAFDNDRTWRPPTGASGRSGRSGRSIGSQASSRRSSVVAGSAIARSSASSGRSRGEGYMRQVITPNRMYNTTSDQYGSLGHVGREPVPGREGWLLGRGGGQQSSFDNCLQHKGHHVPLLIDGPDRRFCT